MSTHHVSQLLALYDPLVHADTIRMHVEHVRTNGTAWWGRLHSGPSGAHAPLAEGDARAMWPHLAKLADARAERAESSVLFVTNHTDLHACKVVRVAFGDDPTVTDERGVRARVRDRAHAHYRDRRVAVWFEVSDVRALSFDVAMTLGWFRQKLGAVRDGATGANGVPFTRAYDPYSAAHYRYPIVLGAPTARELFDDAARSVNIARFADLPQTIRPMRVQRAHDALAETLAPIWRHLEPGCREALANAWVLKRQIEHDDLDPAVAFTRLAIGVETELCIGLVGAIEELVADKKRIDPRSPSSATLREVVMNARPAVEPGEERARWTLGSARALLGALGSRCKRQLDMLGLSPLASVGVEEDKTRWLRDLNELRNAASHARVTTEPRLRGSVDGFFADKGRGIAGVVAAKRAVQEWRAS